MDEIKLIPITKEFDKEKLANAVAGYMQPSSTKERLIRECEGDVYTFKVQYQNKKNAKEWIEGRSVQLMFDDTECKVGIHYQLTVVKAKNDKAAAIPKVLGGGVAFAALAFPVAGPIMAATGAATGAAVGMDALAGVKFKNDIIKLVQSYICNDISKDNIAKKSDSQAQKKAAVNEVSESTSDVHTCSCGKEISNDMKFCPYCGEKV